jgi:hypothetical protein
MKRLVTHYPSPPQTAPPPAIESINAVMGHLGSAALELVTDTNKLLTAVRPWGGGALHVPFRDSG